MKIVVFGSAIVDVIARPTASVRTDASNEADVSWSAGGAGRNVAENLMRLGAEVTFVTDIASDPPGQFLLANARELGLDVRLARRERTGVYLAILDREGGLDRGYCQTGTDAITLDEIDAVLPGLSGFDGAVIDANLATAVITALAARCRAASVPYALETAAHDRSRRVAGAIDGCALIKPDRGEAEVLTGLPCRTMEEASACAAALTHLGAHCAVVSLGADGVVCRYGEEPVVLPARPTTVVDVTGAGDALLSAAFVGLLRGLAPSQYLAAGLQAAALACAVPGATNPALGPQVFDDES